MSVLQIKITSGMAAQELMTNIIESGSDKHAIVNRLSQYISSIPSGQTAESADQPRQIEVQVQDDGKNSEIKTLTF